MGGTTLNQYKTTRALTVEEFDSGMDEWAEKSTIPVKNFKTLEEEKKKNQFQACFARLYERVIDKLEPLK